MFFCISPAMAVINITGGVYHGLITDGNEEMMISGGSIFYVEARADSRVTMSGGEISFSCAITDNAFFAMSGGAIGSSLGISDSADSIITGGFIENTVAIDNGHITISGGTTNQLFVDNIASITVGSFVFTPSNEQFVMYDGEIILRKQATLTIYGYNFTVNGIPAFGEIKSRFGDEYTYEPVRHIKGMLGNGGIIDGDFQIGEFASIKLVNIPEPSIIVLLSGGLLLVLHRRK